MIGKHSWEQHGGELCLEFDGAGLDAETDLASRVESLYESHYRSIWRYLVLTGSPQGDAEEYVQEAFLRLFRYLKTGQRIDYPKKWLLTTAHRMRIDEREKRARQPLAASGDLSPDEDAAADQRPDPEEALLERERCGRLHAALQRLSSKQCEYLNLRAEGLRLREIAELYGVTVQSVAETCTRAMDRLGRLADE